MAAPPSVLNELFDFRIHRETAVLPMRQAHRHLEVEINYLEAGEATYLIGGRLARVPAERFSFFWGSIPHQLVHADAAARGFWYVTVPLMWVLSWELPPRLLRQLLNGELLCDCKPNPGDAARFADWQEMIHTTDRRLERPAMLEVEARFRRFALDLPRSAPRTARRTATSGVWDAETAPRSGAALNKIEALSRHIVENYQHPLTLADIAAAAGLHPNYAANLFRKHCGQTLLQCLNQHRIACAQRLLATTDTKVIDVAGQSGFGSQSRFYEAFVHSCGVTPAAYRRRFMQSRA